MTVTIKTKATLIFTFVLLLCVNTDAFPASCVKAVSFQGRRFQINSHQQISHWPLTLCNDENTLPTKEKSTTPLAEWSPPPPLLKLNASTKWIVTLAHTIAVWSRPCRFHGPFIVVGSILSVYLADFLKGWINQGRPNGAPFVDPGMPSSHALVSFFSAAAWMGIVASPTGRGVLLGSASVVAWLRVICGYHTVNQIAVGSVLGVFLGWCWTVLGQMLFARYSTLTFSLAWVAYLSASTLFIKKKISKWVGKDKNL